MANTYVKIASVTVGAGGSSSINFSSIPATYTDLKVLASVRTNYAGTFADWIKINFNGVTTGYSFRELEGQGNSGSQGSYSGSTALCFFATCTDATANTFGSGECVIPNYTSSNYKSYSVDSVSENNASSAQASINAGMWSNTAAITSIVLFPNGGTTILQYSTATLYGISKS